MSGEIDAIELKSKKIRRSSPIDLQHYEQKIRNLEEENQDLRAEAMQLKLEAENYEQQEQAIMDTLVNDLGR